MVKNISDYGMRIKMRLLELGKNQNWLIDEVALRTGLFFDSGYLYKIMVGTSRSENITSAINEILGFESSTN